MPTINALEVMPLADLRLHCRADDDGEDRLLEQYAQAALEYCLADCDDPAISTAALVPLRVKQAALMLVAHWFNAREAAVVGTITAEVPLGVKALLWSCRNFYGSTPPEA